MALYMNPLFGIPSLSGGYIRVLMLWFYTQNTGKLVMLQVRGDKQYNKLSYQRTLKEDLKLWRLMQFCGGRRCIPHHRIIIYIIISDVNSTMQYMLKHTSRGVQVQVLNPSKGKLDE